MLIKLNSKVKFIKNNKLIISDEIENKICNCWNKFIKNHENYWNGEIIVATNIELENSLVELSSTNYSSIIYAKKNNDIDIKPLFAGILLKTKDNKYLIIKNNNDKINIIGGMADKKDFLKEEFLPDLCIKREVLEEIGIDLNDTKQVLKYDMKYLKVPESNENYCTIGILYNGFLNYTSNELRDYLSNSKLSSEIKEVYYYSKEECLELELKKNDISYLKEFIMLEEKY